MILKVGMRHGIGGVSGAWAQHRGMPAIPKQRRQDRASDCRIAAIQFAACGGAAPKQFRQTQIWMSPILPETRGATFPLRSEIAVVQ